MKQRENRKKDEGEETAERGGREERKKGKKCKDVSRARVGGVQSG